MSATEFDWEGQTAAAWTAFQARLADHLSEMTEDDLLLLEVESGSESDGAAPYVQFCAWGSGQLRCEAVSNHYLAVAHRLDKAARARLRALGFERPERGDVSTSCKNYWVDLDASEVDRLAVMAVRALRDVYGVVHPAFLMGDPIVDDVPAEPPALSTTPGRGDHVAVYPVDGFDQLKELVDDALTPWLGHPPVHDEDDDIPVDCGDAVVFVRVLPDKPVVRLFACLMHDVEDASRAAVEVALLNRDQLFAKFLLLGDAVVMHLDLIAWPFVAAQLRDLATQMCGNVSRLRSDLAARLGSDSDEVEDADDAIHPALQTILELEAARPGSVDARLAAAICEHDRDLILKLLTWNQQQEIAWRRSRDDAGDTELAEVCAGEAEQAERTTALLRGALRIVVERNAVRHGRERSARGDGEGARPLPPRPRQRRS